MQPPLRHVLRNSASNHTPVTQRDEIHQTHVRHCADLLDKAHLQLAGACATSPTTCGFLQGIESRLRKHDSVFHDSGQILSILWSFRARRPTRTTRSGRTSTLSISRFRSNTTSSRCSLSWSRCSPGALRGCSTIQHYLHFRVVTFYRRHTSAFIL